MNKLLLPAAAGVGTYVVTKKPLYAAVAAVALWYFTK